MENDYGFHKVERPYFFEFTPVIPMWQVADRLKSFGRCFPADNEVVQVAHVLRKRGRHYLCHFKSLLYLDGKIQRSSITTRDLQEIDAAIKMLCDNRLISPPTGWRHGEHGTAPSHVRDIHPDLTTWKRVAKYTFKKPH